MSYFITIERFHSDVNICCGAARGHL